MPCPQLPSELWLEIFHYCSARDLWLSLRKTNGLLEACAEDIICKDILHEFTISYTFSLGAGTRPRWYDVKPSIILCFSGLSKYNSQYALFDKIAFRPEPYHQRAWEKWNQICCGESVGEDWEWKVAWNGEDVRRMKMPRLMISRDHGAWCDWREMLDGYFSP
ncbi:hypothetical protein AC579_8319 [Lecanosticta acicola]|uniref:F-box domain-containing protein n=1 Tax=Lecanosticta acicola TaxID=111012 RepID=A0AAI9EAW4_9PEZI|nr:hypothetical protein AC579_8319 [Lecanosticta acicola]